MCALYFCQEHTGLVGARCSVSSLGSWRDDLGAWLMLSGAALLHSRRRWHRSTEAEREREIVLSESKHACGVYVCVWWDYFSCLTQAVVTLAGKLRVARQRPGASSSRGREERKRREEGKGRALTSPLCCSSCEARQAPNEPQRQNSRSNAAKRNHGGATQTRSHTHTNYTPTKHMTTD